MNYLTEIKLFYDWLETHNLNPRAIALWYGLMFIANRSGWQRRLPISLVTIEARTHIPRASIYRERENLRKAGLIDFVAQGSKLSSVYVIYSLEERLVSHNASRNASHGGIQNDTQEGFGSRNTSHIETHCENIYKLNYTESDKEKYKKENEGPGKRKSCAKKKSAVDVDAVLHTIEPPWQGLLQSWLEYKRLRKESYRSELGIRKCVALLRNLSANNPQTAAAIIDQSIANNWAGLFELKRSPHTPRGQPQPATGQRIGQIKQPESEERTQKLLQKLDQNK